MVFPINDPQITSTLTPNYSTSYPYTLYSLTRPISASPNILWLHSIRHMVLETCREIRIMEARQWICVSSSLLFSRLSDLSMLNILPERP